MTPPPKFGKNESEWEKKKKNIQRKQENFSGSLLLQ